MAYLSPDCRTDDHGFVDKLKALSKASGIDEWSQTPETHATFDTFASSKAYVETPPLIDQSIDKSISFFIDAAFTQSPDESIFMVYGDDDSTKIQAREADQNLSTAYNNSRQIKGSTRNSSAVRRSRPRQSGLDDPEADRFESSVDEFGDFCDDPLPTNLSVLVEQFAKIIEAEDHFVKLYKQSFQSKRSFTRKALSEKGFKFHKAKMVSMLSSKALNAAVIEDEEELQHENCTREDDGDETLSRLCFNSSSSQLHQPEDLSVVMSICTNQTGQTGLTSASDATSNTAARLMMRLMDPGDHDSELSKELRTLSPTELAKRFLEMQEKLKRKQQKKIKKKKKEKKKKNKKNKKKKKEDESQSSKHENGQQAKSILKKTDLGGRVAVPPLPPKSILRKSDDYFEDYKLNPLPRDDSGIAPFPLNSAMTTLPMTQQSQSLNQLSTNTLGHFRGRSPLRRQVSYGMVTNALSQENSRQRVTSVPARPTTSGRGRSTVKHVTCDDVELGSTTKKSFWKRLFRQRHKIVGS